MNNGMVGLSNLTSSGVVQLRATDQAQTWKKLFFTRKPIFRVKKCPQIQIDPKHIKVPKIAIFLLYQIFSNKNALIVDINKDF